MRYLTLDELCIKESSNIAQKDLEQNNGQYPIYGASGFLKMVDFYHQDKTYIAIVKDGAGIGRTMLLPAKSSVIGTLQYIKLKTQDVVIDYLYYAIVHMNLSKYYSGATIPHIYYKDYKKEIVKIPNLETQCNIVRRLRCIDKLKEYYIQKIDLLDKLVKSRFIELFGDPIKNTKSLQAFPGYKLFKLTNGKFVPKSKRFSDGIPAYGGNGIFCYTDNSLVESETIIVGRVGFQSGNVSKTAGPVWITDNAMYIRDLDSNKLDMHFLYYLMKFIDFTRFQDLGDLKKIKQEPFMRYSFICPEKSEQELFVRWVYQVDKSKYYRYKFLSLCRKMVSIQEGMLCQTLSS